ncbi:MAG TPA: hypothetical protein VIY73_04480, partial [Polyangiaceae bacterium]
TLQGRVGRCDDLVATIALTVAIALDQFEKTSALLPATADRPASDGDPTPPDVDPGPETATRLSNPAPPSSTPLPPNVLSGGSPEARERAPNHLAPSRLPLVPEVAVGVSGWIGTAPSFALGPTASVALRWRRVALGVEGQLQLPASAAVTGLPVGEVRTSLAEAGPVVCLALDPYFVCGVAFVGALHADAPGVPGAQAQTGVEVLAGPRAGTAVALGGGLSLRVSLDLLAEAYGPTVQAAGVSWRPSPVAGGAQIALAWRIP